MASLIGQRLGQYEILSLLGEGGMAAVYRARQLSINRDVAIKVIRPVLIDSERLSEFVLRFEREGLTIAALDHPYILKLYEFGQHEGTLYLVMPLLTGGSLMQLIQDQGPLPAEQAGRLLEQVASALDHAHGRGVIHRDLKPANILLDSNGHAILTDFGIAKVIVQHTLTQSGLVMGTPSYMSPEQWRGHDLDARSDVYALGIIAYEMLTGQTPFVADTPSSLMYMHLEELPPSVRSRRPDLPPPVDAVLAKALAKDRDQRFSSAGSMAAAFKMALTGQIPEGLALQEPEGLQTGPLPFDVEVAPEYERPRPARRTGLMAIGTVVILGVIGVLVLLLSSSGGGTPAVTTTPTATAPEVVVLVPTSTASETSPASETPAPTDGAPVTNTPVAAALVPTDAPTGTPTPTSTVTGTATATGTDVPPVVIALTNTPPPTFTSTFTLTGTDTPTSTLTELPTLTPSATPTQSPTPDIRASALAIIIAEMTQTATLWTLTPTYTYTPTPDFAATVSVERTAIIEETLAAGQTATAIAVASFTRTPTQSVTMTPTASPAPTADPCQYVVEAGDTLFSVAQAMGVTVEALIAANGLSDLNLQLEQILVNPGCALLTTTPAPAVALVTVTANDQWTPVVQSFDGVDMVLVPAGCFQMGSNDGNNDEKPVHDVCFDQLFWIDRFEVTNKQFAQFGGVAANESNRTEADHPREMITWFEARDFCAQRDARLPTEAEWEYAARGPSALVYPWGNAFDSARLNACDRNCEVPTRDSSVDDGYRDTAPVGSYSAGATWVGALDMAGNVWEWVNDWYGRNYYSESPSDNPAGPSNGETHVLRGGSWTDRPIILRTTNRPGIAPDHRNWNIGFRCARSGNPMPTVAAPDTSAHTPTETAVAQAIGTATLATSPIIQGTFGATLAPRSPQYSDVLAYCDWPFFQKSDGGKRFTTSVPISVWWSWWAHTPDQIQDHLDFSRYAVNVEKRDGDTWQLIRTLDDYASFQTGVEHVSDRYYVHWYVPIGMLEEGQYRVNFQLTWTRMIDDGESTFGPSGNEESSTGSCAFEVGSA